MIKENSMKIVDKQISKDGSIKYCLKTNDNNYIETVYIPGKNGIKLCISTQIGCEFNCRHCATAKMNFKRKLTADEIIDEINICLNDNEPQKYVEILFYGMGEPITNLDAVVNTIKELIKTNKYINTENQFYISTSGIPNGIKNLIEYNIDCNLAISLHSAIDSLRKNLIPHGSVYNLKQLREDILYYQKIKKKHITIHYCLINDFNNDENNINALVEFLKDIDYHIDLIPFNEFSGSDFKRPGEQEINNFMISALNKGINIQYKPSKAQDINGACGQLAIKINKI